MRGLKHPLVALVLAVCLGCSRPAQQATAPPAPWYENAVIYEIYPRSFADTNADGVGDLNGITAHLDYLKDLGVDAIWITPFYPSPQVDFGYDISDYEGVDPRYGAMQDLDRLIAEANRRNIRVITDLVLNHTSNKHPWFVESSSSRTNLKADWYVWADGKPGPAPPNNWQSIFGGSAWQWDPARKQYYYHAFYTEQPDLNWHNRQVRDAIYGTARFWMNKGVMGFRLDAVTSLFEDPALKDEPTKPGRNAYGGPIVSREYSDNLPEVHDVLRELRRVTDEFPGRILVGETYLPNIEEVAKMYGANHDETQLPMNTQFAFVNRLSAQVFREKLRDAETRLNGNMPLLFMDNHDNPRSWNRYGDGKNDTTIAKLIATLQFAPRGTALLYYGQEIGMMNNDPKRKEDVQDPIGKKGWPKEKGRDGERTPMQWNAGPNAGFSTASKTWLPVAPGYQARNVEAEQGDPGSMLNYYKALVRLRKDNAAFRGGFQLVNENDPDVLAWIRTGADGKAVLVALNFSSSPKQAAFDLAPQGIRGKQATTLVSSFSAAGAMSELSALQLPAYGAYVGAVQ